MKELLNSGRLYQSPNVVTVRLGNEDVLTASGEPVLTGEDVAIKWDENWNVGGGN